MAVGVPVCVCGLRGVLLHGGKRVLCGLGGAPFFPTTGEQVMLDRSAISGM